MTEKETSPTLSDKIEGLVEQIYFNMLQRGIIDYPLVEEEDEHAINKSELRVLAYHVKQETLAAVEQALLDNDGIGSNLDAIEVIRKLRGLRG